MTRRTLRTSRAARWAIAPIILLLLLLLTHDWWLSAIGEYLVQAGPPAHSDLVVVLAGDWTGNRILKAAELVREGYAPKALVSGPGKLYNVHEDDAAIDYAVDHGYPRDYFIAAHNDSNSTRSEAIALLRDMRRMGVHSADIVTSDFHTHRAGGVYRKLAGGIQIHMVAAPYPDFNPGSWWRYRQGEKTVLLEWTKTVAYWFGI
ncbi:MAG TPA: YdcF family protein [Bryobacteraceae bacterium]|nr:YdcF family protein [Bryobacteraceae bacterium]